MERAILRPVRLQTHQSCVIANHDGVGYNPGVTRGWNPETYNHKEIKMNTEQQFEITRQELKQRLDDAIKAQNYPTAEHWLEKLKMLDEAECLLMAYAPEQTIGG